MSTNRATNMKGKQPKILVAGSFNYEFYDEACAKALESLDCLVSRFRWNKYYGSSLLSKMQQRWLSGPGLHRLNKSLLDAAAENLPDVIFITRGVPIWSTTLTRMKQITKALIVSNNNDDPFGPGVSKLLWRHFVKAIPLYDVHFVFRQVNVKEYLDRGAKVVRVLMPYYVPELHYPYLLNGSEQQEYDTDVIFVGHAKDDERIGFLKGICETALKLRLCGWHWSDLERKYPWLKGKHFPPVWGTDYLRAVRGAKIALVFFTKANRDTYTTRSFEIPAIGTCMLSERTSDMLALFREDVEAMYFSTADELVKKCDLLLKNRSLRDALAKNALLRLGELKASVKGRMEEVIAEIQKVKVGI